MDSLSSSRAGIALLEQTTRFIARGSAMDVGCRTSPYGRRAAGEVETAGRSQSKTMIKTTARMITAAVVPITMVLPPRYSRAAGDCASRCA